MQNFKQDENIEKSKKQTSKIIEEEMKKYLSILRVERISSKPKDYIQPINPMSYKLKASNNLAEKQRVITDTKQEENRYNILYFNPELKKYDVIQTTSKIEFQTVEQKVIEESLALRNNKVALEHLFGEVIREQVVQVTQLKKPIAISPIKISQSMRERDKLVAQIDKEIRKIELAIEEVKKAKTKEGIRRAIKKLSPLTRKRMEALLKKGDKTLILKMLVAEDFFLNNLKFFLVSITPRHIKKLILKLVSHLM